jgi:hypothetical protein
MYNGCFIVEVWLEEKVRVLASELRYARSIDTYLVKFSSLIYELEDQCLGDYGCIRDLFKRILEHPALIREISTLACHVDEVIHMIQGDPRFKNLRNYGDLVEEVLKKTTCIGEKELVATREPTFRVEREERVKLEKPTITSIKYKLPLELLLKIAFIVAIILIVLGVLFFTIFK